MTRQLNVRTRLGVMPGAAVLLALVCVMPARQAAAEQPVTFRLAAEQPAAGPAAAQQPAAQSQASHWPGWPPADIKRGEPAARGPASDLALEAVQAAVATCTKNGFKSAALVVDSVGEPVAMFKAEGAPRIDLASATRKAFVVIYTKKPSADAAARVKTDSAFAEELAATGKALPVRGGLPIKVGGEVIGAIAVGGAPAPGEQDEICSQAGLDKIASRLK
ncbi:MAG: heme-binding protein [Gammaproteobacteria bacterium]